MFRFLATVLTMAFAALTALPNDGPVLSVPAGGIQFTKTDAIAMVKEDLFIGEDVVRVSYVYRNTTSDDFTTEVAFPLPIYSLDEFEGEMPRYSRFTVSVNGNTATYGTVGRAVLCEVSGSPFAAATRGDVVEKRDITDLISKFKISVANPMLAWDVVQSLGPDARAELIREGACVLSDDQTMLFPLWKEKTAYVWTQTFPANSETRIEHEYVPQIGYFHEWHLKPFYDDVMSGKLKVDEVPEFGTPEFNSKATAFLAQYGVDDGVHEWAKTQRAANKRFSFTVVDYILTTAAYWKGPIKDFTLTIETPGPVPVALAATIKGLKKLDDRRFQLKQSDFAPEHDLSIVFIHAYDKLP